MYQFIFPGLFIDRISGRTMVTYMYFITISKLFWSLVSGTLTLVHRNNTSSWIAGCALFEICISCATKW